MTGIKRLGTVQYHLVEVSPFVFGGKLLMFESVRPRTPDNTRGGKHYLRIRELHDGTRDAATAEEFQAGKVLCEFGEGFTFGVPMVHDGAVYVYACPAEREKTCDISVFRSTDLQTWTESVAITGENEGLFNSSVCEADGRFVMAYETNDRRWPAFHHQVRRVERSGELDENAGGAGHLWHRSLHGLPGDPMAGRRLLPVLPGEAFREVVVRGVWRPPRRISRRGR